MSEQAVVTVDQLAEEDYAQRYGPRPTNTRLVTRSWDSCPNRFILQEKLIPFLDRYPNNVVIFYEVNLAEGKAIPVGWLFYYEVQMRMKQEDHWVIYQEEFHEIDA